MVISLQTGFAFLRLPKLFVAAVLIFAGLLFSSQLALTQFTQQGSKLVGINALGPASQGWSVALSGDGNTAIVGGREDDSGTGAAWVFTPSGGVWAQQGSKLVGTGAVGNANQGTSVALSGDGNTAIVGGWGDNSRAGAVWVFTRSGGVWSQQGSKLVGTGGVEAAQGWSVALSDDGNTAVVGGPGDHSHAGAVWVFTRSGGAWSQQGSKLVGTSAVGNSGFSFVNWTANGSVVSRSPSYTFTVNSNVSLVANFTPVVATQDTIAVSASPSAGGTVSGGGTFAAGSSVTVTATPNSGFNFVNWTVPGTGNGVLFN